MREVQSQNSEYKA
jgi:hypothetical protein